MSVFIGEKGKRVELAERKDATNPNLLTNSKGPFQPNKGTTDNWGGYPNSVAYLEQGQTYTISGKTNGTWSGTHNNTTESDRCVLWFTDGQHINTIVTSDNQVNNSNQFVWTNPTDTYLLRVNTYKTDNSTKVWDIKVEKGTVATPWCPAIEDYAMKSDTDSTFADVRNRLGKLEGTQALDGPDFNSITASGIYFISNNANSMKNSPTVSWGTLVVSNGSNARTAQVFYPDSGEAPWFRMKVDQTWTAWQQLGTKADVNAINSKVNVDGPLFKRLTQFDNWSDLFDGYSLDGINATNGNRLVAFRDDIFNSTNTVGKNGTGVAFGGGDTKGVLSVSYNSHTARIAGGNGNAPVWHEDIAWKSDLGTKLIKQDVDINTLTTEGKFFVITNNLDHFPTGYRNPWYFLEVVASEITASTKRIKQTVMPDNTDTVGWTMTRTGVVDNGETINWKSWLITDYANGKVLKG